MTRHEELAQHADEFEAKSLVETTRIWIEGRHADEHVRAVTKDAILGPLQER